MDESFIFEAPSDEDLPNREFDEEEEEVEQYEDDGEAIDDDKDDDDEGDEDQEGGRNHSYDNNKKKKKKGEKKEKQSPWDFGAYSESVAEEHTRRSTTSIDYKITQARLSRPVETPADEDASSDSDPNIQEDYREEDDEDEDDGGRANADESKPFYEKAEKASFHANSFMDLNLSRPLLRACEALGYTKPTPIQVD